MDVIVAKTAGFCFGVKRAVELAYDISNIRKGPIYTYGPIIHNSDVVNDLKEHGVNCINSIDEIKEHINGTIIIRSHGVTEAEYNYLKKHFDYVEDATCPFVERIHKLVHEHSMNNNTTIIIGDSKHPEVIGIVGWASNSKVHVICSKEEAMNLEIDKNEKILIVSQTTFNNKKFEDLVEIIIKKRYDINVVNTICSATRERQEEAEMLSGKVDSMIVIGDRSSSNTQKLYEICMNKCKNTYYIQTINDLDLTKMQGVHSVGITAGASTPNTIIEEVQKNVRNEF